MQYTVENLQHYFDDEFGNYDLCFTCDFHITDPEEMLIKDYPIPSHCIQKYMKEKHTRFYEYVCSVRHSLDTWGPQTGLTFEALGEDAQELFYKYTLEYMQQEEHVKGVYEQQKKLRHLMGTTPHTEVKFTEKKDALGELADEIKMETKRGVEFKNRVTRALRKITIELYPELMDAGADDIRAFRKIFVNDVLHIQETVDKFRQKLETSNQE